MNRYVVVISDGKDNLGNHVQQVKYELTKTETSSSFPNVLQELNGNNYIFCFNLSDKTCKGSNISLSKLQWSNLNTNFKDVLTVTSVQGSEILFHLTDKLSYPGSYILDVYWHLTNNKPADTRSFTPLLGALKKLKLWHLADISLLVSSLDCSPTLFLMSKFISAKFIEFSDPEALTSIIWMERQLLWRGSIELKISQLAPVKLEGFQLVQHSCCRDYVRLNSTCKSNFSSNLWFGNTMKVIELIDLTTLPLFWFSGSTFLLQCANSSDAGIKFKKLLEGSKNSLLCRLSFINTTKKFPPCIELNAQQWKNSVRQNPLDLQPPVINLCEQPKYLFLALTTPTNDSCRGLQSLDKLYFHAHALHLPDDIDASFIVDQKMNSIYQNTFPLPDSRFSPPKLSTVDITPFQNMDHNWGQFFSKILKDWKKRKSSDISVRDLQTLILESYECFKEDFESRSHIQDGTLLSLLPKRYSSYIRPLIAPEIEALKLRSVEHSRKLGSHAQSASDLPCASLVRSKIKSIDLTASDILTFFDGPEYQATLNDLRDAQREPCQKPSVECLSNFSSAIVTAYHGVNFNIDAQGSEKMDQYYRKLTKKLIRFETLSLGSKTQVLSPITSNFDDSPLKRKKSIHTPRKKKKLIKVAEKLYRKRTTNLSNPAIASSMKTPTKKKSIKKGELLDSPSVHKMSLRSSTPSKGPSKLFHKVKLTPNSKAVAKKKVQKQYVSNNKKRLRDMVLQELRSRGITKGHSSFDSLVKKLFRASMALLKDLKTSKDLENKMKRIVKENARLVLSLESLCDG